MAHRDGTRDGYDLTLTRAVGEAVSIPVIASGGLASIEDVKALLRPEYAMLEGAISGRALYDGRVTVADAIRVLKG